MTYPSASAAKASLRLALPDTRWWPAGAPAPPLCSPSPSSKFTYRFWPAGALPPKHLALPFIDDAQPLALLHDEVLPALPQEALADLPEHAQPLVPPEDQC